VAALTLVATLMVGRSSATPVPGAKNAAPTPGVAHLAFASEHHPTLMHVVPERPGSAAMILAPVFGTATDFADDQPSARGEAIAFVSNRPSAAAGAERDGDIWYRPGSGAAPQRVTTDDFQDSHPVLSPDGRRIAYSSLRGGRWHLYVVQVLPSIGTPFAVTSGNGDDGWPT
jgi:hypothetical protein